MYACVHQPRPHCPFCGTTERDAWEINFGPGLDGTVEHSCGSCGREYVIERSVTVTYSTSVKK